MSIIVKRATKGSGLTSGEIDANVNNLNNDKVEINNPTFKAAPSLVNNLIPLIGTVLPAINPSLNLDFANGKQLDPRITFSRNTVATYINKYGLLVSAASNVPRFDYDPITKKPLGLLIEEIRTNSLLNSTIDGANLATQSITTTAVARTLSFYGTGTIVLSGTKVATIVGLGAYPTRTTYTYTPTAGTLTLTVSGTVQYANDEVGAFATSYIPTVGTALSRAVEYAYMTGTNFSSWYNQSEGSFFVAYNGGRDTPQAGYGRVLGSGAAGIANSFISSNGSKTNIATYNGSVATNLTVANADFWDVGGKAAMSYSSTSTILSGNGFSYTNNTLPTWSTKIVSTLGIGGGQQMNGHISKILYYPKALTAVELKGLTS